MENRNEIVINGIKIDAVSVEFKKERARNLLGWFYIYTVDIKISIKEFSFVKDMILGHDEETSFSILYIRNSNPEMLFNEGELNTPSFRLFDNDDFIDIQFCSLEPYTRVDF